ncbi:MAG TPA: antibiotic biosynthesis monooxygenase [Xanthobacteraceae bacterium]|nr:antibiotic biosynthesis monooxygenase [Xanthobacteraceae bacterium]
MRQAFQFMLALAPLWLAAAPIAHAQNAGDPTVYVVRYIEVMPAAQEQAAGLIKKLADASRKEAGAVRFDVLQRAAPANQFATFEIWKDQASLDAHGAAAHKQFLAAAQPLLIAPVDDRLCVAIDTAPPPAGGEGAIYAITHVDVAPPNREAGIALLKGVAGPIRKENGNVAFDALQQSARTNHFEVVEIWKDQKAEDAHEIEAATKDYRAKVQPLLGAHYDRRWYKAL